jgi:hypothetical protein
VIRINLLRPFIPPQPEELTKSELYLMAEQDLEDGTALKYSILDTAWEGRSWTFSLEDEREWYESLPIYPDRWEVYRNIWENRRRISTDE